MAITAPQAEPPGSTSCVSGVQPSSQAWSGYWEHLSVLLSPGLLLQDRYYPLGKRSEEAPEVRVTTDPAQPQRDLDGQESLAWHFGPCSTEPELPFKSPLTQSLTLLLGLVPPPFASAIPTTWSTLRYLSLLC